MVGRAGRDRVRHAAVGANLVERVLPALLEADPEPGLDECYLGAHDSRQQDVADSVVHRVRPIDPTLLHQAGLEAELGRDRGNLSSVIRLHAANRDQMCRALGEGVRDQVLQLAGLVAAECQARVAVLPLGPDPCTAKMFRQPLKRMDRARPEQQGIAREVS